MREHIRAKGTERPPVLEYLVADTSTTNIGRTIVNMVVAIRPGCCCIDSLHLRFALIAEEGTDCLTVLAAACMNGYLGSYMLDQTVKQRTERTQMAGEAINSGENSVCKSVHSVYSFQIKEMVR